MDVVLLQPLGVEPPPHAKCKDKFLVQSAFIKPDEEMRTLSEMVRFPPYLTDPALTLASTIHKPTAPSVRASNRYFLLPYLPGLLPVTLCLVGRDGTHE
jgi:hypothetical protein